MHQGVRGIDRGAKPVRERFGTRGSTPRHLHWDCQHETARPAVCMTSPLSVRQLLWYEA